MNRNLVKKFVNNHFDELTVDDLKETLKNAYKNCKTFDKISIINKGFTKAVSFNIFSQCVDHYLKNIKEKPINIVFINVFTEFGEYSIYKSHFIGNKKIYNKIPDTQELIKFDWLND